MLGGTMLLRLSFVMMTSFCIERDRIVVQAQSHKNHRTCSLHDNEIVYLYYNSTVGMYVRYNNETDRRLSSFDDGNDHQQQQQQQQQHERIRINNDNILYPHIGWNKSSDYNHSPLSNTTQPQQRRSERHDILMNPYVRTIQNDEELRPEPAIAMVHAEHRRQQATSLTTSEGSNRNRGDGDRIRNVDPNIELYQPYDGRIITVRSCHCSDRNTYNNNIRIDNVTSNYTYYCPLSKNYCYVPIRSKETPLSTYETYPYYYHPICIPAKEASNYVVLNLKLIGCGALALITILLLVSPTGHNAIRCCCSTFVPGCFRYNHRYIDYMIQNDSKLTKHYLEKFMKDDDREERFNRRYTELQRLHGESAAVVVVRDHDDEAPGECNNDTTTTTTILNELEESIVRDMYYYRPSLLLKTRRYLGPPSPLSPPPPLQADNRGRVTPDRTDATGTLYDADVVMPSSTAITNDDEIVKTDSSSNHRRDGDGCMICFNAIDIGSKVGILPNCEHTFHTTCLKEWLKRRNICPLCLDTDVATVAFSRKNDPSRGET